MNPRSAPRRRQGPQRVSEVLERLVSSMGIQKRIGEHRAWQLWPEVVGPAISSRTRIIQVKRGIMLVAASSPAWAQELTYIKRDILAKMNDRLGDSPLNDIRFVVGE
jgi:predicted nucleic acid-binding Zn ribbon protein